MNVPEESDIRDENASAASEQAEDVTNEDATDLPDEMYYQLTHDFLVPALREWLTKKQAETMSGRAEIRLDQRSALWNAKPENQQLPPLWEFLNIRLLTSKKEWRDAQRSLMRAAGKYHAIRGLIVLIIAASLGFAVNSVSKSWHGSSLVAKLANADIELVPDIIKEIHGVRNWTDQVLQRKLSAPANFDEELRVRLALLPVDETQVNHLVDSLLDADPEETNTIRQVFLDWKGTIADAGWQNLQGQLWSKLEQPRADKSREQLRLACALALLDPNSQRWTNDVFERVTQLLVAEQPSLMAQWKVQLRPIAAGFVAPLAVIFRDGASDERVAAADILSSYAKDHPAVLAKLILDASEKQFNIIFPTLAMHAKSVIAPLETALTQTYNENDTDDLIEKLAHQKANAAVALLKLGKPDRVWQLLEFNPDPAIPRSQDPRVRSHLIHRKKPLGVDANVLIRRLIDEQDLSARRALVLSLGEYNRGEFLSGVLQSLDQELQKWYLTDIDAGIHSKVRWLLGQWNMNDKLSELEGRLPKETENDLRTRLATDKRDWYVSSQGHTFAIVRGPVEFVMGSPPTESGRESNVDGTEQQHKRRINRSFAIATHEVTLAQFLEFRADHKDLPNLENYAPRDDCPAIYISWYDAAAYCNWLSKNEGIDDNNLCYDPHQRFGDRMKMPPNYLTRTGYRLPTEAEWEYACRAGATTSRFHGEAETHLDEYAWYIANSGDRWTVPVGQRKPNDFGLFDVFGNVAEWCHDRFLAYPSSSSKAVNDIEDTQDANVGIIATDYRILRGGGFSYRAALVRSASRDRSQAQHKIEANLGFRVARTYPH